MTTAAIDLDTLNKLFDNQKRLDDIFDSMFDEDPFLSSPTPFSDYAKKQDNTISQKASNNGYSNDELLFSVRKSDFVQRLQGLSYFVLPALELIAIYYGVSYLT